MWSTSRLLVLFPLVLSSACGADSAASSPPSTPPSAIAPSSPSSAPASSAADTPSPAAPSSNEAAGQAAAQAWLATVDAGNYPQSWTDAATLFRGAITQAGWQQALQQVRAPLGKVVSRNVKAAKYVTHLQGAPDGEYVVVQFDTTFENRTGSVETVTPMKDKDGQWRVSGYFIK